MNTKEKRIKTAICFPDTQCLFVFSSVSQTQRSYILAREESTCWARTLFVGKQKRRLRALRSRGVEISITRVVIVLFMCNLNGGPTSGVEVKGELSESIAKRRIESNLLKDHFGCSRLGRGTGFSNLCKQKTPRLCC